MANKAGKTVPTKTPTFMDVCESCAELYSALFQLPTLAAFSSYKMDEWKSLQLFCSMYAFQRQGASPDYPNAAVDALRISSEHGPNLCGNSAALVWSEFCGLMGGTSLNWANNPICPANSAYVIRKRSSDGEEEEIQRKTKGLSILEFAHQECKGRTLFRWANDLIVGGDIRTAYCGLKKINGIGGKIASSYLRDIAVLSGVVVTRNRKLLQPIDTWTRFAASEMAGHSFPSADKCAEFIVKHSAAPERANQGMWFFCTQV